MKKWISLVLVILVCWNVVLTVLLLRREPAVQLPTGTKEKVIREVVTSFTTDITDVVADVSQKVVGISAVASKQLLGTGSGFIYRADKDAVLIVTNHHVVQDADEIFISFANGKETKAKKLGSDLYSDLALLSTTVDFPMTAVKLGDSNEVKVGEVAIAIGNPLGQAFQGSTTQGIISGKDRILEVDLDGDYLNDWDMVLLQTDAAINPGNSGGPLINANGEVVGINSLKINMTNVEGFGFAIPVNEMIPIVEQLEQHGEIKRPQLGISARAIAEMSYFERGYFNVPMDAENGLLIVSVMEKSAAMRAGLQEGDILTSIDSEKLSSFKSFRKLLYSKKFGDTIDIAYMRGNESKIVRIKLT